MILLLAATAPVSITVAQHDVSDLSGNYQYSIVETPYGDFFGTIILKKKSKQYLGEIIDEDGVKSHVNSIRVRKNQIVFKSNLENTNSLFTCEIVGDSIMIVKGDDFPYVITGKRASR